MDPVCPKSDVTVGSPSKDEKSAQSLAQSSVLPGNKTGNGIAGIRPLAEQKTDE